MLEGLEIPNTFVNNCKIKKIGESLNESDNQIFHSACDNPKWPAKALAKALAERGIEISDTTILRHRRRECKCG